MTNEIVETEVVQKIQKIHFSKKKQSKTCQVKILSIFAAGYRTK
jgi:hypothetical protein